MEWLIISHQGIAGAGLVILGLSVEVWVIPPQLVPFIRSSRGSGNSGARSGSISLASPW